MIRFENISKVYNDIVALDNVNLAIDEKEFIFLIGPSGSGKTTLIKLLIRDEDPTNGNIFLFDTDVTKLKGSKISKLRREVGVVFQDFKLLPHKNLFENISFALEVSGKNRKDIDETVAYVLDLIDLSDRAEAYPDEISGGEKQKVAIARAIANNPKILIADEPTGNLDPESSWDVLDLLTKINEWGTTIIMATHGSEFVNSMGKRAVELDKGKITSDSKKQPTKKVPDIARKKKKDKNEKKLEKIKPKDVKKKEEKKKNQSKEFDITFTTKPKKLDKKGTSKQKSKQKKPRKGKDVVDLEKLKLPAKIEEKLLLEGITTIKQLKSYPSSKLQKVKGLSKNDLKRIQKSLENAN